MGGAERLEDPSAFPYVQGVAEKGYSPDELRTAPSIPGISAAQASTGQQQATPSVDIGADPMMLSETPSEQEAYLGLSDYKNLATLPAALYDTLVGIPSAVAQNVYEFGKSKVTGEEPQYVHSAPAQTALYGEVPSPFRFYEGPKLGPQTEDEKARVQAKQAEAKAVATDAELDEASRSFDNLPVTTGAKSGDAELYDQAQAVAPETAEEPKTQMEMLMDVLAQNRERAEKQAEMDKYLALAQAGATLASSKDPTFLGALGEATQAGIGALQGSREALSDVASDELDVMKALAVAEATGESKATTRQLDLMKEARAYDKMINDFKKDIIGEPTPDQAAQLLYLEQQRDIYRVSAGLPPLSSVGGVSGASNFASYMTRRKAEDEGNK
jgi:hypothetical protein